jgi:hypothetical protein
MHVGRYNSAKSEVPEVPMRNTEDTATVSSIAGSH